MDGNGSTEKKTVHEMHLNVWKKLKHALAVVAILLSINCFVKRHMDFQYADLKMGSTVFSVLFIAFVIKSKSGQITFFQI